MSLMLLLIDPEKVVVAQRHGIGSIGPVSVVEMGDLHYSYDEYVVRCFDESFGSLLDYIQYNPSNPLLQLTAAHEDDLDQEAYYTCSNACAPVLILIAQTSPYIKT